MPDQAKELNEHIQLLPYTEESGLDESSSPVLMITLYSASISILFPFPFPFQFPAFPYAHICIMEFIAHFNTFVFYGFIQY